MRRCALFNYDSEKNVIEFRHYLVSAQPVGVSRSVKKIIQARIPDLSNVNDIADFVQRYVVDLLTGLHLRLKFQGYHFFFLRSLQPEIKNSFVCEMS